MRMRRFCKESVERFVGRGARGGRPKGAGRVEYDMRWRHFSSRSCSSRARHKTRAMWTRYCRDTRQCVNACVGECKHVHVHAHSAKMPSLFRSLIKRRRNACFPTGGEVPGADGCRARARLLLPVRSTVRCPNPIFLSISKEKWSRNCSHACYLRKMTL